MKDGRMDGRATGETREVMLRLRTYAAARLAPDAAALARIRETILREAQARKVEDPVPATVAAPSPIRAPARRVTIGAGARRRVGALLLAASLALVAVAGVAA